MVKKYYCDYCDRSFIDDVESRKKHLKSNNHIQNRKRHYALSRDLETLVAEERAKRECIRFRNTGYCPFELSCIFTHYSKEELDTFDHEVKQRKLFRANENNKTIEDWLKERQERGSVPVLAEMSSFQPLPGLEPEMLPPSLRPVPVALIKNYVPTYWG